MGGGVNHPVRVFLGYQREVPIFRAGHPNKWKGPVQYEITAFRAAPIPGPRLRRHLSAANDESCTIKKAGGNFPQAFFLEERLRGNHHYAVRLP